MEEDVPSVVPTGFDSELIKQLGTTGFQLQHPDRYFSFIEKQLPIVGSMAAGGELLYTKKTALSLDDWLEAIRAAITRWAGDVSSQDLAVVVGDNMLNYAYALPCSQFIKHVGDFFSIPQDTYVLLQKEKLCFQYTYEDELFLYHLE